MSKEFFRRKILGRKARGIRLDPVTGQTIVMAKHIGDIVYPIIGDDAIAKKSEVIVPTREQMLNPVLEPNLNEVGENKHLIKRTAKSRYVRLD